MPLAFSKSTAVCIPHVSVQNSSTDHHQQQPAKTTPQPPTSCQDGTWRSLANAPLLSRPHLVSTPMFFYLSLLSTPCLRGRLRQNTPLNWRHLITSGWRSASHGVLVISGTTTCPLLQVRTNLPHTVMVLSASSIWHSWGGTSPSVKVQTLHFENNTMREDTLLYGVSLLMFDDMDINVTAELLCKVLYKALQRWRVTTQKDFFSAYAIVTVGSTSCSDCCTAE